MQMPFSGTVGKTGATERVTDKLEDRNRSLCQSRTDLEDFNSDF